MPYRDVTTIKDLIHYQYAKAHHYGFIKQTFRELQNKLFTYLRTSPWPPLGFQEANVVNYVCYVTAKRGIEFGVRRFDYLEKAEKEESFTGGEKHRREHLSCHTDFVLPKKEG